MKAFWIVAALVAIVAVYFIWVRPYLKSLPSFAELFVKEGSTWAAIKEWLDGRKTILIGVWGEIIAMAPGALQAASGFDLKTLLGLPEHWAAYVTALLPVLMTITRAMANPKA